jgi:hypothetical protein
MSASGSSTDANGGNENNANLDRTLAALGLDRGTPNRFQKLVDAVAHRDAECPSEETIGYLQQDDGDKEHVVCDAGRIITDITRPFRLHRNQPARVVIFHEDWMRILRRVYMINNTRQEGALAVFDQSWRDGELDKTYFKALRQIEIVRGWKRADKAS